MNFKERLHREYKDIHQNDRELSTKQISELEDYLRSQFIFANEDNVTIYVCNGGGVACGFPNITKDEKYTAHIAYLNALKRWLNQNELEFAVVPLGLEKNETPPPAHGQWLHISKIRKIVISSKGIR